jgi:PleD family two-component response regulator
MEFIPRLSNTAIILPDTDLAGARRIAERIQTSIAILDISHAGSEIASRVTVSLEITSIHTPT